MFECMFEANPIMYDGIQWLRHDKESDEEVIVTDGSRRFTIDWDDIGGNTVRSRLIIRNATVQDAGKIFCSISNGYGKEAREETFLLVKRKYKNLAKFQRYLFVLVLFWHISVSDV